MPVTVTAGGASRTARRLATHELIRNHPVLTPRPGVPVETASPPVSAEPRPAASEAEKE